MAFAVRTTPKGVGNSLGTIAGADDYFADRGTAAWTGTDTVKQGALVRATDYIDRRFSARYTDEVLEATDIPEQLAQACYEYALRALTQDLAPDPTVDASGVSVVTTRKKLGPLEKEFQVVGSGTPQLLRPYPGADMLMAGLLNPASGRVIR